jgi:hypothetical protein
MDICRIRTQFFFEDRSTGTLLQFECDDVNPMERFRMAAPMSCRGNL